MATQDIWLLVNARSGSNSEAALEDLKTTFADAGIGLARIVQFPDDDLPTPAALDAAGIGRLAIFTGDGTLNAALTALYGWSGEVIVLPGGTKNLLSIRLHGEATSAEIVARIAGDACRAVRPLMARCDAGDAIAGLLAGPGAAWVTVREAMRDGDIAGMAQSASEAVAKTTSGPCVRCAAPERGFGEGYPLIEFTPCHRGIQLDGYRAQGVGEVLQQSWALLRRNFREGPSERLGLFDEVELENVGGEPIEVLIDGEPATLGSRARFTVAECEVDLLATEHGF